MPLAELDVRHALEHWRCYQAATKRRHPTPHEAKVGSLKFVEIDGAWRGMRRGGLALVAPLNQRVRGSIPRRPIFTTLCNSNECVAADGLASLRRATTSNRSILKSPTRSKGCPRRE